MNNDNERVFEELDLNLTNIDYLYDIIEDKDKKPNSIQVQAFSPKITPNPSKIVFFDQRKLAIHSQDIDFMFGQLLAAHDRSAKYFPPETACFTYRNVTWTRFMTYLMDFFELGIANRTMTPFMLSKDGRFISMLDPKLIPTINTSDPRYSDWVKQYKIQYKPKFKVPPVREPHDD
jgi:hypothetical protein